MTDREIIEAFLEKYPGPWRNDSSGIASADGKRPLLWEPTDLWAPVFAALINERCGRETKALELDGSPLGIAWKHPNGRVEFFPVTEASNAK